MNRRHTFPLIMFAVFTLIFTGCGKEKVSGGGPVITEERSAANFHRVRVNGNTNLFVKAGNEYKVQIKGYENLVSILKTTVENGILTIEFEKGSQIANDNTEAYITMPSLVSVQSYGNSEVDISGKFVGMDVFTVEKNGLGNILMNGVTATNFKLNVTGNAEFKGFGLQTENAIVSLTGNGNVELSVTKTLNATINGNGNIYYKGSPVIESNISGNGKLIQK